MKKSIATIMICGALMSVNKMYADGSNSIPPENPEKTTSVTFENMNFGDRLYIKDSENQTLYSEKIKTKGTFTKGFDFTKFPENQYYFEIDKENVITLFPFHVGEESVTLLHDLKENIVKPEIKMDGNMVILTRDVDEAQSLKIAVYFKGRDLVYSETLNLDGNLVRKYDLSRSASGKYLFNIEYNNRVFEENIYVQTMNW